MIKITTGMEVSSVYPRSRAFRQHTSESCLASCLLTLVDDNPTHEKELWTLRNGLEFTRWNFVVGHLDYIARMYKKRITWYIEFADWIKTIESRSPIKLLPPIDPLVLILRHNVNLKLVNRVSPSIVYIDSYSLFKDIHYPHAIIVYGQNSSKGEGYNIYDPWEGDIYSIAARTLERGIVELRNRLKYSPQVIKLE